MPAKILTLATSKGGVGKSTLARNLATYWLSEGFRVAVVDADPQGSIANRHVAKGILEKLRVIADPEETVGETIDSIKNDFDYILVDTGGFKNRTTVIALLHSRYALIPLKPSSDDFVAAIATHTLIRELNETPEREYSPIKYRMVLTMSQYGTIIARHVRTELEKMGYLTLKSEMYHRVIYPETAISGMSPCITEPNGAAAKDISNIAKELDEAFLS